MNKLIALFSAVTLSAIGCSKPAPHRANEMTIAMDVPFCAVVYSKATNDPFISCQGPNGSYDDLMAELVKFKRGIAEQNDVEDSCSAADGMHKNYSCYGDRIINGLPRNNNPDWPKKRITHRGAAKDEKINCEYTTGTGHDTDPCSIGSLTIKDAPKPETQLWSGTFINPKDEHGCNLAFPWNESKGACTINITFYPDVGKVECSQPSTEAPNQEIVCSYKPDPKVEPKQ